MRRGAQSWKAKNEEGGSLAANQHPRAKPRRNGAAGPSIIYTRRNIIASSLADV